VQLKRLCLDPLHIPFILINLHLLLPSLHSQCNALIVGNEARWFMSLSRPTFSGLVITVAREDKWALVTYLLSEEYGDDDADDDVEELPPYLTLVKKDGDKTYRIIIISNVCALFGAIQYSQTTAELDFISWNKVFSMFTNATFVEQKACILTRPTEQTVEACASYLGSDGIEIKTLSWDDTDAIIERSLAVGRRRVGDKST
jgi:hypothetical protein